MREHRPNYQSLKEAHANAELGQQREAAQPEQQPELTPEEKIEAKYAAKEEELQQKLEAGRIDRNEYMYRHCQNDNAAENELKELGKSEAKEREGAASSEMSDAKRARMERQLSRSGNDEHSHDADHAAEMGRERGE